MAAIPLYVVTKGSPKVWEVDSRLTYRDNAASDGTGGVKYEPVMRSAAIQSSKTVGGFGKLGNFVQNIEAARGADVIAHPVMDDQDILTQQVTVTKVPEDEKATEFPFHAKGRQARVNIKIKNFDSEVQLGRAEMWVIPSREHK